MAAITASGPLTYPSLKERQAVLQAKIDDYATRMGIADLNRVKIIPTDNDELDFEMSAKDPGIQIADAFLIDPFDVPHHLRLKSFNDPRLKSETYLYEAHAWLQEYLGFHVTVSKYKLWELLKLWSDPELAKKSIDWSLCHEAAHIARGDVADAKKEATYHLTRNHILSFLVGAFVFAAVGLIFSFTLLGTAIAFINALALAVLVRNALTKSSQAELHRSQIVREKAVDLLAARISNCPEGGAYGFEVSRSILLDMRNDLELPSELRDTISPLGNNLEDTTHPPYSERIKYLRNFAIKA